MKKLLCLLLVLALAIPCPLTVMAAEFPTFWAYTYESEPNNSMSTANYITVGGNYISGKMNSSSDIYDYFKFYVSSGEPYEVTIVSSASAVSVDCLNANGASLGIREQEYSGDRWVHTVDFNASYSGYYYIRVKPGSYAGTTYMVGVWESAGVPTHTCAYTIYQNKVEPTCTGQGYEEYMCICGKTIHKNYVPAAGHTLGSATTCTTPRTCMICGESIAAVGHAPVVDAAVAASCTTTGLTEGSHCNVCSEVLVPQSVVPALGHTWDTGVVTTQPTASNPGVKTFTCSVCKTTKTETVAFESYGVERIKGKDRYKTSLAIADATKEALGVEKFDTVIIASGTGFADALAGSYLAKVKEAPILMTDGKNNSELVEYISSNLSAGGKIYILGGTGAVPQSTEDAMKGMRSFKVERISGTDRYATNIEILKKAGVTNEEIIVATGTNFADSLSASAVGKPILLVDGKKSLSTAQKEYLASLGTNNFYVVGGTSAVSESMKNEVAKYGSVERIAGSGRHETSVAIAEKFFTNPDTAVVAYAWNFPDGLCGGPLALSLDAPLILTKTGATAAAEGYIEAKGIQSGKVLGGVTLIDDTAAMKIFNADRIECE